MTVVGEIGMGVETRRRIVILRPETKPVNWLQAIRKDEKTACAACVHEFANSIKVKYTRGEGVSARGQGRHFYAAYVILLPDRALKSTITS